MLNIVLIGGGNQASYAIDIILKVGGYNIVGIIDSKSQVGSIKFGYSIIGYQEDIINLIGIYKIDCGLITIGDNWSRYLVSYQIKSFYPNFSFPNLIHPSVTIGINVEFGEGALVMAGCIINPNSTIGNFVFFATGAQIEHNCIIDDYASISAGSITGGFVHVGRFAAITLGVVIVDRINIGENTVVGSGSLVLHSLPSNVLAFGRPAKIIKTRKLNERFLK